MSVELHVYCYGDDLAPLEDVRELLEVAGWETRFVTDAQQLEPLNGAMLGTGLVLAWESDTEQSESAAAAVESRNPAAVAALFKENHVAGVAVDLEEGFSADPEELAELEDAEVEAKYIEAMAAAKLAYTIRTSASRNKLSLEFQELLWNAIAVAAYGLAHDPESDSFEDNRREIVEA